MTGSSIQCPRPTATVASSTIRAESNLEGPAPSTSTTGLTHLSRTSTIGATLAILGGLGRSSFPYFAQVGELQCSACEAFRDRWTRLLSSHLCTVRMAPVQDFLSPFLRQLLQSLGANVRRALGLGPTGDPKGGIAIGAYSTLLTIDAKNASRSYAGNTRTTKRTLQGPNLKVLTGAFATKVVFAASAKTPLVATGRHLHRWRPRVTPPRHDARSLSAQEHSRHLTSLISPA